MKPESAIAACNDPISRAELTVHAVRAQYDLLRQAGKHMRLAWERFCEVVIDVKVNLPPGAFNDE